MNSGSKTESATASYLTVLAKYYYVSRCGFAAPASPRHNAENAYWEG